MPDEFIDTEADCTQCKWMLRGAYMAQELLSTFSTDLGEVALIPSTGGIFTIDIMLASAGDAAEDKITKRLWDRASDGGFPGSSQACDSLQHKAHSFGQR